MSYKATNRSQLKYHAERYNSLIEDTELAQADRVASYLLAIVWSCGVTGVGNTPHDKDGYSAYTSTRLRDRTVVLDAADAAEIHRALYQPGTTGAITRKERGVMNNLKNDTTTIKNTETPGTAAEWLKNRQMRQLDIQLECVAAAYVGDSWYFAANTVIIIDSDVMETLEELGTKFAKYHIVRDDTPNMHAEMKILKYLESKGVLLKGINIGVSKPCCPRCKTVLEQTEVSFTSFHNTPVDENRWAAPF